MAMTTEVIGFDNLSPDGHPVTVPNGYEGLNWANVDSLPANFVQDQGQSGYLSDHRSGDSVGVAGLRDPATISADHPFALQSGYFAASWDTDLRVEFDGYLDGVLVATRTVKLDNVQTFLSFGHAFKDLDSLTITTGHGHPAQDVYGRGKQLAMEDVTVGVKGHAAHGDQHHEAVSEPGGFDAAAPDPAGHHFGLDSFLV